MTIYNKTTLKTFFEQGDVPTGTDYANLIDSCVNMAETATQSIAGALNPTELVTPVVSAGNGTFTGNLTVGGTFSQSGTFAPASISTGDVSANVVWASAYRSVAGLYQTVGIVSALGSTQATAAPVTFAITQGAGVVDGTTTGFILLSNKQGLTQYIINGAASANLYPCVGGQINALASNAAFGLLANTPYTIIHSKASGYAVK